MVKSVLNAADREALLARVHRLTPDARARWGRFTAPQMVVHLCDSMRMYTGELPVAARKPLLRYWPLKQLVLYVLPFPRHVPTARELLAREPGDWQASLAELRAGIERLGTRPPDAPWAEHPVFGPLTARQGGVLTYRHMDHHLRQFGV